MAMQSNVTFQGLEEFEQAVKKIASQFKRQELLKPLRRSTEPTIKALRLLVTKHTDSGNLYDSVGNITGKSKSFPNVLVGYRVGRFSGFHGHLLEFGTKPRFRGTKKSTAVLRRGKYRRGRISTGTMPALHLVEKAHEASQNAAVAKLEQEMLRHTEKILNKVFR